MKKLFTSDRFFLAMVIISSIGLLAFTALNLALWPSLNIQSITILIDVLLVALLYYSYKKHSKNSMKALMGALLMSIVLFCISSHEFYAASDKVFTTDTVGSILAIILSSLMFINHLLINREHTSSPKLVLANQIVVFLFALNRFVSMMVWVVAADNAVMKIADALNAIAYPCLAFVIVCVESRLDAYRLDREAAGWTEETGYPDGYVHEYQKK